MLPPNQRKPRARICVSSPSEASIDAASSWPSGVIQIIAESLFFVKYIIIVRNIIYNNYYWVADNTSVGAILPGENKPGQRKNRLYRPVLIAG
jgi:hypothetical protein